MLANSPDGTAPIADASHAGRALGVIVVPELGSSVAILIGTVSMIGAIAAMRRFGLRK